MWENLEEVICGAMVVCSLYGAMRCYWEWVGGGGLIGLWSVVVVCGVSVLIDNWNAKKRKAKRKKAVEAAEAALGFRRRVTLTMPNPPSPPGEVVYLHGAERSQSPSPRETPSFIPSPTPPPTAQTPLPPTPPPKPTVHWDWTLYYTTELPTTKNLKRKRAATPPLVPEEGPEHDEVLTDDDELPPVTRRRVASPEEMIVLL